MYHTLFIHLLVNRYLGCFYFLNVTNKCYSEYVQVLCGNAFCSLGHILGVDLLGHMVTLTFKRLSKFSLWLHCFTLPPVMYKFPVFCTSLPILSIAYLLKLQPHTSNKLLFYYGFTCIFCQWIMQLSIIFVCLTGDLCIFFEKYLFKYFACF